MNLQALAKRSAARLAEGGIPDAPFEAELLARIATGATRAQYYAGTEVSAADADRLVSLVDRRLHHEPTAYITGTREFCGLEFEVTPAVLIPRPESELLVELGLAELARHPSSVVVDVGTGSGCVAVSVVASAPPEATVVATDVSPAALGVARRNAARHGVRVNFVRGHLSGAVSRTDIVLANLPYIPSRVVDTLDPEVRDWEPRSALDGGSDGLGLIRPLIADCAQRLRPGLLALEVQYDQATAVAAIATHSGASVDIVKDYAGIERVVCARWR
ncbi:MAG TPA: peptide chain release factor N(5)-glutamine methyltransferase [Tepidiformaceae bacterium]